MLRRLLVLPLAALALLAATGCASDVSPAVRIGDLKVSNDDLLSEVDEWAESPTLLAQLQLQLTEDASPGTYPQSLVAFVVGARVSFEIHNRKFEDLGLSLSDTDLADVRAGLFSDPAATQAVFSELGEAFADRLIADVARQYKVSVELVDGYQAWLTEAYADAKVELNPRYGTWDAENGQVIPPTGPAVPAGGPAAAADA